MNLITDKIFPCLKDFTSKEVSVLIGLSVIVGDDIYSEPISVLSNKLNISSKTLIKCLKTLKTKNFIDMSFQNGGLYKIWLNREIIQNREKHVNLTKEELPVRGKAIISKEQLNNIQGVFRVYMDMDWAVDDWSYPRFIEDEKSRHNLSRNCSKLVHNKCILDYMKWVDTKLRHVESRYRNLGRPKTYVRHFKTVMSNDWFNEYFLEKR